MTDENVNIRKCYNCGKVFRKPVELTRHKNRKTPCLIREVAPADIRNPNRCIYCNKVFSRNDNLAKHLKTCKIKNGGMELLADKVQYEQEIRILKEQRELDKMQNDAKMAEMAEKITKLSEQVANINTNTQIITNNTTINNVANNTQNIIVNFHNCNNPKVDTLKFSQDDFIGIGNVYEMLIRKIYFNTEVPENHVIYLPNIKDRKRALIYRNDNWTTFVGEQLDQVLSEIKYTTNKVSVPKLNYGGDLYNTDDEFAKLTQAVQKSIISLNNCEDERQFPNDKIIEIAVGERDLIKSTREIGGL